MYLDNVQIPASPFLVSVIPKDCKGVYVCVYVSVHVFVYVYVFFYVCIYICVYIWECDPERL